MIFNVSGGGGTALNFRVVGNPKPSTAKENTIWIDTDVPITSYIFSATQPTGSAGMVWISTGTSSTVEFNALKKNGIQIYPLSAKQYVSGKWVDKTAKSWQGGELVPWWNGELYTPGNEWESVTGGWTGTGYTFNGGALTKGVTKGADGITVTAVINSHRSCCGTENKINLKGKSYLKVLGHATSTVCKILISSTKDVGTSVAAQLRFSTTEGEMLLPLSGVQGEYYISFLADDSNSAFIKSVNLA